MNQYIEVKRREVKSALKKTNQTIGNVANEKESDYKMVKPQLENGSSKREADGSRLYSSIPWVHLAPV